MNRQRVARLLAVGALALGGLTMPATSLARTRPSGHHRATTLAAHDVGSTSRSLDRRLTNRNRHSRRRILAHMA